MLPDQVAFARYRGVLASAFRAASSSFQRQLLRKSSLDHVSFGADSDPMLDGGHAAAGAITLRRRAGGKGTAHIQSPINGVPGTFTVRDRKLPSGRPTKSRLRWSNPIRPGKPSTVIFVGCASLGGATSITTSGSTARLRGCSKAVSVQTISIPWRETHNADPSQRSSHKAAARCRPGRGRLHRGRDTARAPSRSDRNPALSRPSVDLLARALPSGSQSSNPAIHWFLLPPLRRAKTSPC